MNGSKPLSELKPGEEVAIIGFRYGSDTVRFAHVSRIGKASITLDDNSKWRLSDGYERGGDVWHKSRIDTDLVRWRAEWVKQKEREEVGRARVLISDHVNWSEVPVEVAREVRKMFAPYIKKEVK